MNCKECCDRFSDLYDGLLPDEERGRVDAHLNACTDCVSQWDLFKESLSSLSLLGGAKAAPGFKEGVFERMALRESRRRPAPWRLALSPAGIAFCTALLLVGGALGFALGKHKAPFPLGDVEVQLERNGIAVLQGRGAEGLEYVLVPLRERSRDRGMPREATTPAPQGEELYVGGNEAMEFFLKFGRGLEPGPKRFQDRRGSFPKDTTYRAMLKQSY